MRAYRRIEVAVECGISATTLWDAIRMGYVPDGDIDIGNTRVFSAEKKAEVIAFYASRSRHQRYSK